MITHAMFENIAFPEFSDSEILRYANSGRLAKASGGISELLSEAKRITSQLLKDTCRVMYRISDVKVEGEGVCNFGFAVANSSSLGSLLSTSYEAIFMCATLGVRFDALIMKYSRTSPALAHMISSVGSERIEAVCNEFCNTLKVSYGKIGKSITPRFSPGYGDLGLEFQKDIFSFIQPQKYIGLTLNDSLLMSPSKSVSAIMGIKKET